MAKKINIARAIAGDSNIDKIGTYKESTGGGTPLKKGEKLRDHPEAHRVSQPRDEEGKFTYNAVNEKPLKYGPSRGVTIPPFLKGVKLTFAIKRDTVINYNGLTHLAGINMTAKEFINKFREFDRKKGFGILTKEIVERKKGRKSAAEKEVIANKDTGIIAKPGQQRETIVSVGFRGDEEIFLSKFRQYRKKLEPNKDKLNKKKFVNKYTKKSDKINSNLAKNNPALFIVNNKESLDKIVNMAEKKGYKNFNKKAFVKEIADGKYKNWSDVYNIVNKMPPKGGK